MNVSSTLSFRKSKIQPLSFRRSSLDNFSYQKLILPRADSSQKLGKTMTDFRKSHSSFDRIMNKSTQQQSQSQKIQKDIETELSNNIYFNPNCRTKYFKNLIDSYFDKSEPTNNEKIIKRTSILRQGYLRKHQQLSSQNNIKNLNPLLKIIKQQKKQPISSLGRNPATTSILQSKSNSSHQTPKGITTLDKLPQTEQKYLNSSIPPPSAHNSRYETSQPSMMMFQEQHFLPRITQAADDFQGVQQDHHMSFLESTKSIAMYVPFEGASQHELNRNMSQQSIYSQHSSSKKNLQQKKQLIYSNAVFMIFSSEQNKQNYHIKQFHSKVLLQRHLKMLQHQLTSLWSPYNFHPLSLITPALPSLSNLIKTLIPHPTNPLYTHLIPTSFHSTLLANNCQELYLLFGQVVGDFGRWEGRLLNNYVALENFVYVKGRMQLRDFQYAAYREQQVIQAKICQRRVEPILQYEQHWLVRPQCLATQILASMIQSNKSQFDLWQYANSDTYSLGLAFLQIITLIPFHSKNSIIVKSRSIKPRQGCLTTKNRSISRLIQRQKCLPQLMNKILEREIPQNEKNPKFFNILLRMIDPNPAKRIKISQISHML